MKLSNYQYASSVLSQIEYLKDRVNAITHMQDVYLDNLFLQHNDNVEIIVDVPADIAQQILEQEKQKCQERIKELKEQFDNL